MTKNTVALTLDGHIPTPTFSEVVRRYTGLLSALAIALDVKDVEWSLDILIGAEEGATEAGIAFRGEGKQPENVERLVDAYGAVGTALEANRPIPYSPRVARQAKGITAVLNGDITALRFHTPDIDATVYSESVPRPLKAPIRKAYGAVAGRIQTLPNRQDLRFTLYDALFDKALSCYLQEGEEEIMRDMWGRMAVVEGLISRDALSGRPISIRQVFKVTPRRDVEPGSFLLGRGAVPASSDAELPEVTIRRLRDA
jgi:hypothetical protein